MSRPIPSPWHNFYPSKIRQVTQLPVTTSQQGAAGGRNGFNINGLLHPLRWFPAAVSQCSMFMVELQTKVREDFTITEKAPNLAFFWLKVPSSNFTFKKLLRHYAKQVFTHFKQS